MKTPLPEAGRRAASRLASFRHAFAGWWFVLRTQRNAWIHAVASVAVLAVGLWLELGRIEWAILALTIALVWVAEFVNTAVEAVVDLLSPNIHPLAKVAKDVAAAAVLIAALTAIVVGLLILGPPLWARLKTVRPSRAQASVAVADEVNLVTVRRDSNRRFNRSTELLKLINTIPNVHIYSP
ncbi:MAG TPA: diacylglycerol kinase family protein [Gemmataceae bacterium]|nr:diacylglycerol kinase family protein [Gemmataceae bacterium]